MATFFIILSSLLTVVSTIPYLIDIIRGKTKPRVVSWLTWSLLTCIAMAASLADKQYPAAILMFFASIETVAVVILGWKYGDRKFEKIDIFSIVGAGIGLLLWLIFNSPAIAVLATVTIDLIGGVPTLMHSWKKPHEETWVTFFLGGLGGLFTILAVEQWKVTAVAYPIYIFIINMTFTTVLILRSRYMMNKHTSTNQYIE